MVDLNSVYAERNAIVSLATKMAIALGYESGFRTDEQAEDEWKTVIYINLPTGQVSWHIHERELLWFRHLPQFSQSWDGHSTAQKYDRVLAAEFNTDQSLAPHLIHLENSGISV